MNNKVIVENDNAITKPLAVVYTLDTFHGNDSYFDDSINQKKWIDCSYCYSHVFTVPRYCLKCEGLISPMCGNCHERHKCMDNDRFADFGYNDDRE